MNNTMKKGSIVLVHRSSESGDELYHYGVLGMKWGVRRVNRLNNRSSDKVSWEAHKLAKKAAVLERNRMYKKDAASLGSRNTNRLHKKELRSEKSYNKAYEKLAKKYKDTKYSDIHVSDKVVSNGRIWVGIALGKAGYEDGGYPLFNATGGASVNYKPKSNV